MWVMPLVGEPPCQCFSPGKIQTTSPGRISRTGPPSVCTRPTPEMTYNVWPSGCMCQFVRAPGSKDTWVATTRAGAAAATIGSCQTVPVKYSLGARRVGLEPARWISMGFLLRLAQSDLFFRGRIARLGLGVHGIQPGQHRAIVDLIDDPAFHLLLLGAFGQNEVEKRLWNHHGAVLIGDDDVVREDGDPATADRLAPADECQAGDRRWRGVAVTPYRQSGAEHAVEIAHNPVGHQRSDPTLDHPGAQDIAKNTGIGDAHRVDHGDAAVRHGFDRRSGRYRRRP